LFQLVSILLITRRSSAAILWATTAAASCIVNRFLASFVSDRGRLCRFWVRFCFRLSIRRCACAPLLARARHVAAGEAACESNFGGNMTIHDLKLRVQHARAISSCPHYLRLPFLHHICSTFHVLLICLLRTQTPNGKAHGNIQRVTHRYEARK
jgi:hypothetical protein